MVHEYPKILGEMVILRGRNWLKKKKSGFSLASTSDANLKANIKRKAWLFLIQTSRSFNFAQEYLKKVEDM
jgi:hypothetical protein